MRCLPPARIALALIAFSLLGGCRGTPDPERELRELLRGAEAAVETKDFGTLKGLVSERYADAEGSDRKRAASLLRIWLRRHGAIYLATRVQAVRFPATDRAETVVLVAMAAERLADSSDFAALRGDLYRFDQAFGAERGNWKLIHAAWRPIEPGDLL